MGRPGLMVHPKFRRLCRLLKEPPPHVRGYLECLWEVAYQNGDEVIGDSVDVEAAAGWPGVDGLLTAALLAAGGREPGERVIGQSNVDGRAGFIDEVEPGRFAIHDLYDHAPNYVPKRAKREAQRRLSGQEISEIRRLAGRKGALTTNAKRWGHGDDQAETLSAKSANDVDKIGKSSAKSAKVSANGVPPAPAPAPAPLQTTLEGVGKKEGTAELDLLVFQAWLGSLPIERARLAKFTDARRRAISARRNDGHDQKTLMAAAVGWKNDPWEGRPAHCELEVLFRPGNFEKMALLAASPPPKAAPAPLAPAKLSEADQLHNIRLAMRSWVGEMDTIHGPALDDDQDRDFKRELVAAVDEPAVRAVAEKWRAVAARNRKGRP